jgi:hypothetical protein
MLYYKLLEHFSLYDKSPNSVTRYGFNDVHFSSRQLPLHTSSILDNSQTTKPKSFVSFIASTNGISPSSPTS